MIILILMNLIVGISSFLVNYRILKFHNFVNAVISWMLVYFAQIVVTELLLGILGILYLNNVILLNAAILLFVWLITKNRQSSFSLVGVREALILFFKNKIILFGTAIIIGFAIVKIYINFMYPPIGWDSLNYHFTFPVEWLKYANLDTPITISDDPSPSYYPINGSLLFLWLIFPFRNAYLPDIGQLPFFIMAFLAVYNISRKIRLNREFAFYSASLFFIIPNFFKQLSIAYVDVMVAALFLASINFLLEFNNNFKIKDCILWSISFGLFMGTKTSGIIFGLLPFLFFIFILIKNAKRFKFRKIIIFLSIFFLFTVILGGFSYIRNFIQTGNCLYPADIEIMGKKVFKGAMPFSTYRNRWTKEELDFEKLLFHEGMGAQFLLLIIPATFLSLPIYLIKRKNNLDYSLIFILFFPFILYLSFWWLMPQLWVRYLYPFLGIGAVAALYFLDLLNIPPKFIRGIALLCFLASMAELSRRWELVLSLVLSVLSFIALPKIVRLRLTLKAIVGIAILILLWIYLMGIDYDKYEFKRYLLKSRFPKGEKESWVWLNDNTSGCRIAYVGRPDVLPLYGSNFKNDVVYISVNKVHPAKLHYFPHARYVWGKDFMTLHQNLEKKGNYREDADYSVWLRNLESENISYLVVYSLHQVKQMIFPIEDSWAKQHPEMFKLVFENSDARIYKVLK